jgi:hypothetical protein
MTIYLTFAEHTASACFAKLSNREGLLNADWAKSGIAAKLARSAGLNIAQLMIPELIYRTAVGADVTDRPWETLPLAFKQAIAVFGATLSALRRLEPDVKPVVQPFVPPPGRYEHGYERVDGMGVRVSWAPPLRVVPSPAPVPQGDGEPPQAA